MCALSAKKKKKSHKRKKKNQNITDMDKRQSIFRDLGMTCDHDSNTYCIAYIGHMDYTICLVCITLNIIVCYMFRSETNTIKHK